MVKYSQLPKDFQDWLDWDRDPAEDPEYETFPIAELLVPGTDTYVLPTSDMDHREANLDYQASDLTEKYIDCPGPFPTGWGVTAFTASGPKPMLMLTMECKTWILM